MEYTLWFPYTVANSCGLLSTLFNYFSYLFQKMGNRRNTWEYLFLKIAVLIIAQTKETNKYMSSYQTNSRMRDLILHLSIRYEWLAKAGLSFAAQLILTMFLMILRVKWGPSTSEGQFCSTLRIYGFWSASHVSCPPWINRPARACPCTHLSEYRGTHRKPCEASEHLDPDMAHCQRSLHTGLMSKRSTYGHA